MHRAENLVAHQGQLVVLLAPRISFSDLMLRLVTLWRSADRPARQLPGWPAPAQEGGH